MLGAPDGISLFRCSDLRPGAASAALPGRLDGPPTPRSGRGDDRSGRRRPALSGVRRALLVSALLASSAAALPGSARADEPPEPDLDAEVKDSLRDSPDALFKSGLRYLEEKKIAEACLALRQSYRLDPVPVVLFHLARCEEAAGNVATAVSSYETYLERFDKMSPSEQKAEVDHEEHASARRQALLRVLPTITLQLPDDAPAGTKVTRTSREGLDVTLALNVPLPVDPGELVFRVQAAGRRDVEQRVVVKQGEHKKVELPVPPVDKSADRVGHVSRPLEPVPSYLPSLEGNSQSQKIAAYVAGGIGVAGIAVGAISGAYTWGQKSIIENACLGRICSVEGQQAKDTAATFGLVSTVTFIVGGVAAATGIILYVTAPSKSKLSAVPSLVAVRPSGMEVGWQW